MADFYPTPRRGGNPRKHVATPSRNDIRWKSLSSRLRMGLANAIMAVYISGEYEPSASVILSRYCY